MVGDSLQGSRDALYGLVAVHIDQLVTPAAARLPHPRTRTASTRHHLKGRGMQLMNVHHEPSGIAYCDVHYRVLDEQGRCSSCQAEPAPSPWVDHHCILRFRERAAPVTPGYAIACVRRIVMEGRELTETEWGDRLPGCLYYMHPEWPSAVVVVRADTNAAITTLLSEQPGW